MILIHLLLKSLNPMWYQYFYIFIFVFFIPFILPFAFLEKVPSSSNDQQTFNKLTILSSLSSKQSSNDNICFICLRSSTNVFLLLLLFLLLLKLTNNVINFPPTKSLGICFVITSTQSADFPRYLFIIGKPNARSGTAPPLLSLSLSIVDEVESWGGWLCFSISRALLYLCLTMHS